MGGFRNVKYLKSPRWGFRGLTRNGGFCDENKKKEGPLKTLLTKNK
jgi:hypothetical protein